jgi:PAS domain S-box-containing protein
VRQFSPPPAQADAGLVGDPTIALPAPDRRPTAAPAISAPEQAWLTFQAMDQSDDIVLLLESDPSAPPTDAVIIGANGAFRRASGFADDQVLGRQAAELFPIGDDAATLLTAIRAGKTLRTELRCSRANGGTFMLGLHLMPAPARTPGRCCFAVLARDITAVLQARKTQNSIQHLLAKVFILVAEAVIIVDGGGRIVMTNPHVDRLLGYAPNWLVGRSSLDVVAPDARAAAAAMRKDQIEHGGDKIYLVPLLLADGSQLDTRITSVLVGSDDLKQYCILTLRPEAAIAMHTETAGRIRLVGIDEVRAALGERWPAAATRAMATATAVIQRRCGPQDTYEQIDDTSFLMCFGTLSEPEASFRAAAIAREIRERLIGQGHDNETAEVRAIVATVRFPDRGETGRALRAVLLAGLDQQMQRLEAEARQTLQDAMSCDACVLEPISGRNPEEIVANLVRLPAELERKVLCAMSILPQREAEAFDLDGLLLGLAAQQVLNALGQGDTGKLLVNIRFDVFGSRAAIERYAALCMKIDQRVSKRLTLLLTSLPEGLPRSRQSECVGRLRPYCAAVGFQVDELRNLATVDLSQTVNPLVALSASALAGIPPGQVTEAIRSLHARRARLLVRRIATEEAAAEFLSLGADMISMEHGVEHKLEHPVA